MQVVDCLGIAIKKDDPIRFKHGKKYLKGIVVDFIDKKTVSILVKPDIMTSQNLLDSGLYTINSKNTLSKMIDNTSFYHFMLK